MSEPPAAPPVRPPQSLLVRIAGQPLFWVVWVVLIFGASVTRAVVDSRQEIPELPIYGAVPEFSLIDQFGENFPSGRLHGTVWVASFIFTRCPTICPRLAAKIGEIQHRSRAAGDAFKIVSFSVDPEYDTPPVLRAFATKHRASKRMWIFLTGAPGEVERTVVQGMKISMGRGGTFAESLEDPNTIFHGTKVALIDQQMRIRGYYDIEDEGFEGAKSGIDELLHHVGLLINMRSERQLAAGGGT